VYCFTKTRNSFRASANGVRSSGENVTGAGLPGGIESWREVLDRRGPEMAKSVWQAFSPRNHTRSKTTRDAPEPDADPNTANK